MNLCWMPMDAPFIFDKADSPSGMKYGMRLDWDGRYEKQGRLTAQLGK